MFVIFIANLQDPVNRTEGVSQICDETYIFVGCFFLFLNRIFFVKYKRV